jgi:hypothetical protein
MVRPKPEVEDSKVLGRSRTGKEMVDLQVARRGPTAIIKEKL